MPDSLLADRGQPRDSLATKIIFFVFLSTFVTSLVVSWTAVYSSYDFLRTHLEDSYPAMLARSDESVAAWMREGKAALAELAGGEALRAAADGAERGALVRELSRRGSPWCGLVLRNPSGSVRTRVGPCAERDDATPDDPPRRVALRARAGALLAVAPVPGRDGRVASLEGIFAPERLAAQLSRHAVHGSGSVYLVAGDGTVLAAGPAPRPHGFAAFPPELLARPPQAAPFEFRALDGGRGLGAHRRLSIAPFRLVVAQPVEQAYAPVFAVVTRIFVIDLVVVLLFSFLAYEITAAIVRPLEALSVGARRISQGELEIEIADTRTHDELGLLTRTFNDMARRLRRNRSEIEQQHRQLREQNEQLQQANEVLEQLSITDGLTKLHNHRYFQEMLTREIKRVSRSREPLAILLVDIDDFKALNDRFGHAEGDFTLVRIARILNESVRESDILARYGGEEFVVLATGTDLEGAAFLAEKVRTAVAETSFGVESNGEPMRVTVSIGVAQYEGDRRDFFEAADRALYRAKAAGKNCVVTAGANAPTGSDAGEEFTA